MKPFSLARPRVWSFLFFHPSHELGHSRWSASKICSILFESGWMVWWYFFLWSIHVRMKEFMWSVSSAFHFGGGGGNVPHAMFPFFIDVGRWKYGASYFTAAWISAKCAKWISSAKTWRIYFYSSIYLFFFVTLNLIINLIGMTERWFIESERERELGVLVPMCRFQGRKLHIEYLW